MPAVPLAAVSFEPLVLQLRREQPWAVLHGMRHRMEYLWHARTMSRLPSPVAVDVVPALPRVVVARRVVRNRRQRV